MDPDKALDALLSLLEGDGDDDPPSLEPETTSDDSDDGDNDLLVTTPRMAFNIDVDPSSPFRKRPRLRTGHCKFCEQICSRGELEAHLGLSESCKEAYFSHLKVTKIDAVMCILYRCLFCNDGPARLSSHLSSSPSCYNDYCTKFEVNSVRCVL